MKEKIEKFSLKQQIYWNIQCKILCDTLHQKPLRAHRHRHTRCLSVWREHRSLLPLFLIWLMIFIRNAGFGLHISGYWDWNSIQTHKLAPLYIIRIKSSYINLISFEHYRDFCCCDEHGGWSMARVLMDACYYWPSLWTSCPPSSLITPWNAR